MADKLNDILHINSLKKDEIPTAIELAKALRADEVERFLELYDNIPKSLEKKRVDQIKEMARQLASLPKNQFELYQSKLTTNTTSDNSTVSAQLETTTNGQSKDNITSVTSSEETITPVKSTKKKSKKKKKKSSTSKTLNITDNEIEKPGPGLTFENKLLDGGVGPSRIVTMNKTMVADISIGFPEPTASVKKQDDNAGKDSFLHGNSVANSVSVDKKMAYCKDKETEQNGNSKDVHQVSSPPFGFPLSTEKLIQSAIGLLNCEPTNDIYNINGTSLDDEALHKPGNKQTNQSDSSLKNLTQSSDIALKSDESIGGNGSTLSAFDKEEGWQLTKRSQRKKKKDTLNRERSSSFEMKDLQKDSNNRKQTPRDNNRNNYHDKVLQGSKTLTVKSDKLTAENKNINTSYTVPDKNPFEEKPPTTFSYRDALLKTKSKPTTEELQYDSGVDVNSVESCDSSVHSPKAIDEFDLEEAVNYLMKGQVVYHRESEGQTSSSKKKRKPVWKSKHRQQSKAVN